jgi:tetratricopeptide (TPR) repeat protein
VQLQYEFAMFDVFSAFANWRERRQILRELRDRSAAISEHLRFKVRDDLTLALSALDADDTRQATEIWKKLVLEHPAEAYRSPLALKVLIGLRRYDEATRAMRNGQQRSPNDPYFLGGLEAIARARGNNEEALAICNKLRKRFPGIVAGYTSAAQCLRALGRLDEADEMASEAIKRFPEDLLGFLEFARVANDRQDWEEALSRWQPLRDRFGYFGGYIGAAQALGHLGRFDEAEDLLQQARYRTADPGPLTEYARLAEAKGDLPEAANRWRKLLSHFPLQIHIHIVVAEAFERLGDAAEAEATLRAAVDRFPAELRPALALAKLLYYVRSDYAAAAIAWATVRRLDPQIAEGYVLGAQAHDRAEQPEQAAAVRDEYRRRFVTA